MTSKVAVAARGAVTASATRLHRNRRYTGRTPYPSSDAKDPTHAGTPVDLREARQNRDKRGSQRFALVLARWHAILPVVFCEILIQPVTTIWSYQWCRQANFVNSYN
jgi:hypothetical protein